MAAAGTTERATLEVLESGPLTTVQDAGRPRLRALGVGPSGACDRASYALANRLVGNEYGAAVLEVTLGGLALRSDRDVVVATAGARCAGPAHLAPVRLTAGERLVLGTPATGVRTYLAVRGGLDVSAVLGSRSTDLLSGLGPAPLSAGDRLRVGAETRPMPGVDLAPVPDPPATDVTVRVEPGPRRDWFTEESWKRLVKEPWTVGTDSNRIGMRLEGPELSRTRGEELPSEGMVRGALQAPPGGGVVLFLADHPVTGGYPVVGYVADADVDRCAQLRVGQRLRLRAGS